MHCIVNLKSLTMEADKNNNSEKGKGFNPLEGFDMNKLAEKDGINELFKHLLASASAVGINYLMFIRPLQEELKELKLKVEKQDERIKELEGDYDTLVETLNKERAAQKGGKDLAGTDELFTVKKKSSNPSSYNRKRYRAAYL